MLINEVSPDSGQNGRGKLFRKLLFFNMLQWHNGALCFAKPQSDCRLSDSECSHIQLLFQDRHQRQKVVVGELFGEEARMAGVKTIGQ